ncbi:potassium-transporting ATPase subunit F [Mycolicibacterium neoaurum]|nr:potassium-transporting ATPase subunit F [Mycolicibacterium neoaurum]
MIRRDDHRVHPRLPGADHRDLRAARPGPEAGRAAVNLANSVGLVLAILTAVFLFAALLFPERF